METRNCTVCGEVKPIDEFFVDTNRRKPTARCKPCTNRINRERRARNATIYDGVCSVCSGAFSTRLPHKKLCGNPDCRTLYNRKRKRMRFMKNRQIVKREVRYRQYSEMRDLLYRQHMDRQEEITNRMGATTELKFGVMIIRSLTGRTVRRVPFDQYVESGMGLEEFVITILNRPRQYSGRVSRNSGKPIPLPSEPVRARRQCGRCREWKAGNAFATGNTTGWCRLCERKALG